LPLVSFRLHVTRLQLRVTLRGCAKCSSPLQRRGFSARAERVPEACLPKPSSSVHSGRAGGCRTLRFSERAGFQTSRLQPPPSVRFRASAGSARRGISLRRGVATYEKRGAGNWGGSVPATRARMQGLTLVRSALLRGRSRIRVITSRFRQAATSRFWSHCHPEPPKGVEGSVFDF
jgi:hypothetical protein